MISSGGKGNITTSRTSPTGSRTSDSGPYTLYTALFLAPGVTFFTLGAAGLGDAENRRFYLILAGALAVLVTAAGLYLKRRYVGKSDA